MDTVIVYCEQCDQTWTENETLTKMLLADFVRGHKLNHRHNIKLRIERTPTSDKTPRAESEQSPTDTR